MYPIGQREQVTMSITVLTGCKPKRRKLIVAELVRGALDNVEG